MIGAGQGLELRWTPPGGQKEIIPATAFSAQARYIPSAANLSSRLKCQAVTNYGIESEEKSFTVKVYEAPQVVAGGPYTGRPNQPVALKGSMNTQAYPGATFAYTWRTKPDNTTIASSSEPTGQFTKPQEGTYTVELWRDRR